MSPRRSTLADLADQLLRCADDDLLDTPLDALRARVLDDETREMLRDLAEQGEARSVRELLTPSTLDAWTTQAATPRELSMLRVQLRRWLGAGHFGDDDPARLARVEPLPSDVDAILAWARPYALVGELGRPATEVLGERPGLPDDVSLLECALERFDATRGGSLLATQRLADDARAHLVHEAAAHASVGAREALWSQPVREGLRPVRERLRGVIGRTTTSALHAVRFVPARRVTLDAETGVVRGQLRADDEGATLDVSLFLSGHEARALEGTCAQCKGTGCLHVQALAARVLDACHATDDRLHAPLVELVEVPSWKRFLRAISADTHARAPTDERFVFRVRVEDERIAVSVVSQRAGAHGRWSAGKLVPAAKALLRPSVSELDRPALEAMARASRATGAQRVVADLGVLRGLVEHPYVELEDRDAPVTVVEHRVDITLEERPGGLVPKLALGGAPLAPGARPRDATHVSHLDRASGALVFAPITPDLRRLLAALAHFRGVLPPESYPSLAPWLASLKKVAHVTAPKALRGTERVASRTLLLRITPGFDEGIDLTLSMRPLPMGALFPPGRGPELCHGLEDGVQVFTRRDLAHERDVAEQVTRALDLARHVRLEPFAHRVEGTQPALEVLSRASRLRDLVEIEWAERGRRLVVSATVSASDLKIDLFKKGQWLALSGGVHDPTADVAIGRMLDAARRGERFVRVEGSTYVELERDLFDRLAAAQLCVNESVREPVISAAATRGFLDALGAQTSATDAETRAFVERATRREIAPVETAIRAELRGYQRDGVAWLLDRSAFAPGVVLADEMGLGKTVQTIALLDARAALGPALVIAPTSVVGNWTSELARFAPRLTTIPHRGARDRDPSTLGAGDVLVTSYELLLREVERFSGATFATQVIDEAQVVKNARTQRARAVAGIDAAFRVALSGTPVENRLGDLWSVFHLVAPGLLGGWSRFRALFAVPIERYDRADRASALRALVAPFILRRTKRDVARELPSRTEVVHTIALSAPEQDLYDAAVRQARRAIGRRRRDDAARTVQILAELTRLRQLACHPRLVIEDERLESSKLAALLELLGDVLPRGHRVLVFSQFTRHLALVEEALDARGIAYLHLDGATPAARRSELVDRFQDGEAPLFLISLKAGGTGLNLTAADYVIHLDPWWNPAAEDQASDRAHRLGQVRPVTIVKLVTQGTIEEKVLELHAQKRRLAELVLEDGDDAPPLDTTTLEALLALG